MARETCHGTSTFVEWLNACRQVCVSTIDALPKLEGIQIDESYFSGGRKYSRGRVLQGDRARNLDHEADGDLVNDWGNDSNLDGAETYGRDERAWIRVLRIYKRNSQVRLCV